MSLSIRFRNAVLDVLAPLIIVVFFVLGGLLGKAASFAVLDLIAPIDQVTVEVCRAGACFYSVKPAYYDPLAGVLAIPFLGVFIASGYVGWRVAHWIERYKRIGGG